MPSPIDPEQIPGKLLDPDTIEAEARTIGTIAGSVRDNGSDVHLKWQAMSGVYSAPESGTLLGLMQPVSSQATAVGDNLETVSSALAHFAAEVRPIKAELDSLRVQAEAFGREIDGGVSVRELNPAWISTQSTYGTASTISYSSSSIGGTSTAPAEVPQYRNVTKEWHEVQEYVDRNNELISAVNAQQLALWEAERTCANKIRALYGAAALRGFQSEDDALGYGLDEIPEGTEMPWGAPVERTEGCGEATAKFVFKDFLWEGIAVGGVWGTVQGLGTLVLGYNPATGDWFSGDAYGAAWGNLGMLGVAALTNTGILAPIFHADSALQASGGGGFLPQEVRDFKADADEAALNTGKALIAWDKWEDDPGTALGESVFNVGTALIPVGGAAVAGVKTASTAASVLTKMTRVVEFIDPAAWAVNGTLKLGGAGLGSLDNLIGRVDGFETPTIEVYTATDSASAMRLLDDFDVDLSTVTARVDVDGNSILEFPGGKIEMAEGTFPSAGGVRAGDDGAVVAPVREPELVAAGGVRGETGHGPVNSIVDEAPVRTDTGGSGGDGTVARDPDTAGGGGSDSDGSGFGGDGPGSGDRNPGDEPSSGDADDNGTAQDDASTTPAQTVPTAPGIRQEGPMYSAEQSGPHWERYSDTGTPDAAYGQPRPDSGHPQPWYQAQPADNPEVVRLVDDPAAPFGRSDDGAPIADQADWNSRYTHPDAADGSPGGVRWPQNDGAAPGTRVHYDDLSALLSDYPEFARIDRIGGWGGDYLTVQGTVFEHRGLTPGHRAMDYSDFDLAATLPPGVKVEVSVVDEAMGYGGGGWQIRFFRTSPSGELSFLSIDELIDLEVLG